MGLACANWHYVCRYDDGNRVYNIEATDTGRGGFAAGTDQDYIDKEGVSRKAVAVGSDLRKLTAREMFGVFIMSRGRYLRDTGKHQAAVLDFALAHTLFPRSRKAYMQLASNLTATGEALFNSNEEGHPAQLAMQQAMWYQSEMSGASGRSAKQKRRPDLFAELNRINALNRRSMQQMQRMMHPPALPQPYQPPIPGAPQLPQHNPRQPHQPR